MDFYAAALSAVYRPRDVFHLLISPGTGPSGLAFHWPQIEGAITNSSVISSPPTSTTLSKEKRGLLLLKLRFDVEWK